MVLPDINLLVYAYNEAAAPHHTSRAWWEDLMTRERSVALPWAVTFGFLRLITHPAVFVKPLPPVDAMKIVRAWFDRGHVQALDPGPRHLEITASLLAATGVAGSLTTDTHLAALAIEHRCELHSNDADFARFPGLRWYNPIK